MGFDFKKGSLLCKASDATSRWLGRHSVLVLVVTVLVTGALAPFAARVGMDDDVVKFLPEGDPDVLRFQEIGHRFHGLSIGILGVEARDGHLFTVERLTFLRKLTLALREVEGVTFATGLTELRDVAERASGEGDSLSVVSDLVGDLPESAAAPGAAEAMAALMERVLSRDHITGSLISHDGSAALVLAHLGNEARVTDTANAIRATAERVLLESGEDLLLRYGGAPFIGAYVAEQTQRDLRTLAPYVVGSVLVIVFFSFGSVAGMFLAVLSVLVGMAWTMGLMGLFGRDFTLVSSSLPVLLIALGSAYSIHLLTRVLSAIDATGGRDRKEAVQRAVSDVGPPVFAAGLTTALAFLSFLSMDIQPMREFGVWMSLGTMVILFAGLLVVPAACMHLPLKPRSQGRAPEWIMRPLVAAARRVARDRRSALVALAIISITAAVFLPRVTTHMDTKSFFAEGSAPMEAERFLEERLGGSLFVQVQVKGDIRNAMTLRQIDRIAAYSEALSGVTDVQSVAFVVALASQALSGEEKVPSDLDAARSLTVLADDDPNLRLLVDADWKHALVQVKVGGFDTERAMRVARGIASVGDILAGERVAVPRVALTPEARFAELTEVSQHIADLLTAAGVDAVDPTAIAQVVRGLSEVGGAGAERLEQAIVARFTQDIVEDEYVYLREDGDLAELSRLSAEAVRSGTLTEDALYELVFARASDEDRADPKGLRKAVSFLHGNLLAIRRGFREESLRAVVAPLLTGVDNPRVTRQVEQAASVLLDEVSFLPGAAATGLPQLATTRLDIEVSGYPVLYAGMNRSVQINQILSTFISLGLVGLALWWVFRSFLLSLVAVVPAGLTLLVAFGIIGAFGLSLDIGMSMISAIAVGVGIDYAVHLLWKHGVPDPDGEDEALTSALRATGWGVIINTLAVTVGFGLLVASTVVPMQKFGLLTAACMLVSAVGSLLLVPALTRWVAPVVRRGWRDRDADHDGSDKGHGGGGGNGVRPGGAGGGSRERGGGAGSEAPGADEGRGRRLAEGGRPTPQRLR